MRPIRPTVSHRNEYCTSLDEGIPDNGYRVRCDKCGHEFTTKSFKPACRKCWGRKFQVMEDNE